MFLDALFAGKPDNHSVLIWTFPAKASSWVNDVGSVDPGQFKTNCYFGVGTRVNGAERFGTYRRGDASDVAGIGAFWLDVDILGPAHKKGNLPPDRKSALDLVGSAFSIEPSIVVSSGHGIQVYYLLDSFLLIDDENRTKVEETLFKFAQTFRAKAKAQGFDADSVFDLARVMRLPGTVNLKIKDDPQPVEIIEDNCNRFSFDSLKEMVEAESDNTLSLPLKETKVKADSDGKKLSEDATPPLEKWEALKLADSRAAQSWNYARRDMQDQSPSAYDMSLIAFALRAEWTDEEAISLAIACRRFHNQDTKAQRSKYWYDLCLKVREEIAALEEDQKAPLEMPRDKAYRKLSDELGVGITKLVRYDTDPPHFVLVLDDGRTVTLGPIENLTSQTKFRNCVAAAAGVFPTKQKGDSWDIRVSFLLKNCDHDSAGGESTEKGQASEWIHAYLSNVTIHQSRSDGLETSQPWMEQDSIHIQATALRMWVAMHLQEKVSQRQLGLMLRALGCEPVIVASEKDGQKSTRFAWKIPGDL